MVFYETIQECAVYVTNHALERPVYFSATNKNGLRDWEDLVGLLSFSSEVKPPNSRNVLELGKRI